MRRRFKFFECTLFESFVPDDKSGPVPEQDLAFITGPVEKNKQMPAERVLEHHVFREHREPVKTATHICGPGVYEYLY